MRTIAPSLLVTLVLAGCGIHAEPNDHMVINRSNETVNIVKVTGSGEFEMGEWGNGSAPMFWLTGCEDVLLIARTKAGREVARWSGPFCDDDTWLIVDAAGPSPS